MAYRTRINPAGPTRHLGRRGAFKQTTFIQLQKNEGSIVVESAFEAFLARLIDLANDAVHIAYQPFTLDLTNQRVLLTHNDFKDHRHALKESGMTGVYYTPDLKVCWQTEQGQNYEVIEAKDSLWVPH